jgi:hypothetical protein
MSTSVNIADYFNEQQQAYQQRVEHAAQEKASLREAIEQAEKQYQRLTLEIKKKKQLIAENAAEGVDTETLAQKVADLERQGSELITELQGLRARADAPAPEAPFDFLRAELLVQVLAQHGCTEALEIRGLEECIPLLPVGLRLADGTHGDPLRLAYGKHGDPAELLAAGKELGVVVDGAGRPIWCSVGISADQSLPVPVKPSDAHYFVGYRPPLLEWLPSDYTRRSDANQTALAATGSKVLAFLDRRGGCLVISEVDFQFEVTTRSYNQQKRDYEDGFKWEQDNFSDVVTSLREYLEEMLKAASGVLDLNADYPDNPLMAHIKSCLLPVTTPSPRFRPCAKRLRSEEIARRIKADWDAFVQAPWSSAITGSLAAAKHLLESGERPRFWNEAFEGTYGFRLRTRDHDWVLGNIFIDADGSPGSNEDDIRIHDVPARERYINDQMVQIATHGRMSIRLYRESDRAK